MAQRSARARSKLDKISGGGVAKIGFGGLATPSSSTGSPSVSSFSSGRSFGRSSHHKSVFRTFLDSQSDKIRGTLAEKINPVNSKPKVEALPEVPQLRRWEGDGKPAMVWDKLRRDPELWMSEGDTLVFLCDKNSKSKDDLLFKGPSFRIHSSALRATNSPFLIASLTDYEDDLPQTPSSMRSSMSCEDITQVPSNSQHDLAGIACELHFPGTRGTDRAALYRHHATTRNFFAILFNKALVGVTLGQTLVDLVDRMELYMPPGHDNVGRVMRYLQRRDFDDVRNAPDLAAGMLQFAEKFELRDLWRESFVHCVGMMNRLELSSDYQQISPITRALIDRANLEIQVRIGKSDRLLGTELFTFEEMWPLTSSSNSPARHAFDKFQKFLVKHYQTRFGSWPPVGDKFSRMLYCQLQRDFSCLYDYLVDREVYWEQAVAPISSTSIHPAPKHGARFVKPGRTQFRADDTTIQYTDIINTFDYLNQYPHIPHPYPLVPEAKNASFRSSQKQTNFFGKRSMTADNKVAALALMEATNVDTLYASTHVNSLVDAYSRMEKSEKSEIDPHDARKGRWLLIYAVLQTLATVSVDAPGLKWTEGVDYYLCAQLRGTPPWEQSGSSLLSRTGEAHEDFCQFRSHCWTVSQLWAHSTPKSLAGPMSPPLHGNAQRMIQREDSHDQQQHDYEQPPQEHRHQEQEKQLMPQLHHQQQQDEPTIQEQQRQHEEERSSRPPIQQPAYEVGILEQDDFDQLGVLGMGYKHSDESGSSDADDEEDDMEVDEEHDPGHYVSSHRNSEQSAARSSRDPNVYDVWERGLAI